MPTDKSPTEFFPWYGVGMSKGYVWGRVLTLPKDRYVQGVGTHPPPRHMDTMGQVGGTHPATFLMI